MSRSLLELDYTVAAMEQKLARLEKEIERLNLDGLNKPSTVLNGEHTPGAVGRRQKSFSLPPATHADPLKALIQSGFTPHTITMIANNVLNIPVKKISLEASLPQLTTGALKWMESPLMEKYWAIIMASCYQPSTQNPGVAVVGIDSKNHMSVIGLEDGDCDDQETWDAVLQKLKDRGLAAPDVAVVPFIESARRSLAKKFSKTILAGCWSHTIDIAALSCPKGLRGIFRDKATEISFSNTRKDTKEAIRNLKTELGPHAARAIGLLEQELENLLVHHKFDKTVRRSLRSTVVVSRLDKDLRTRALMSGTDDPTILKLITAFVLLRLEYHWRKFPIDSEHLHHLANIKVRMEHG